MRDWPILLTATACFISAAARYVADGGADTLVIVLLVLGACAFGAWIYSMGRKDG